MMIDASDGVRSVFLYSTVHESIGSIIVIEQLSSRLLVFDVK
jgi:hypothetical protein